MVEIQHDNTEAILEVWDHDLPLDEGDNLAALLRVLATENERIDLALDELYDDRFIQSARGRELEKLGDLVGIRRKTGESDAKLRKRIQGAFAAQASDTTFDSFANAALAILDANPGDIDIKTPPATKPKVVRLNVSGALLEENPLTEGEIAILLNGAVSVDGRVEIKATGTFAFDGDNASLEGFNEGTWTSTIN